MSSEIATDNGTTSVRVGLDWEMEVLRETLEVVRLAFNVWEGERKVLCEALKKCDEAHRERGDTRDAREGGFGSQDKAFVEYEEAREALGDINAKYKEALRTLDEAGKARDEEQETNGGTDGEYNAACAVWGEVFGEQSKAHIVFERARAVWKRRERLRGRASKVSEEDRERRERAGKERDDATEAFIRAGETLRRASEAWNEGLGAQTSTRSTHLA